MVKQKGNLVVPEELLVKIWSGFSLKSIARFRSVCKEWKSIIDSDFFRDLYMSLNSSSSVSWSIMNIRTNSVLSLEIVGHHGCERWGLTNSLGSSIKHYNSETTVVWVLASVWASKELTFMIYCSKSGLWKTEKVRCLRPLMWSRLKYSVPLNGILHWLAAVGNSLDANYVVSCDFCHDNLECRIRPFPGIQQFGGKQRFKRTITSSAGFVMYCNVFNRGSVLRVWRLVNYTDDDPRAWQLSWKLDTKSSLVGFGADYFPVVMHPFISEIIYLWSRNKNALVSLNLRTHKFSLHKEESENKSIDGCIMTLRGCKECMDSVYEVFINELRGGNHTLYFSQYVLPRWFNPLPQLSP
ncbi:unnamed protein product [Eruca vesicaria subsp. sativa]|uniref:F-box domain-containing protein n=1 Tax=Eruca vesicaria subsp. sativa TaxID=29727 RepID=A0ABC8IY42_ERUVS|nr:unnamed protein product [Eruca vesicaria subsp. sativa]